MRCLYLLFICIQTAAFAQDGTFVTTVATKGDGVLVLLRRYKLEGFSCNVEHFYLLNNMEKTDGLVSGKKYKLPIKRYKYNGRSIRTTINISDYDLAVRVQEYNRHIEKNRIKEKAYETDLDLWVPHHFFKCPDELKETETLVELDVHVGKSGQYPIFGDKYSNVIRESEILKGQVFYIKGGHGGPDPGAMSKRAGNDLCEDEYAYDVALRLCRHLISRGAIAYMIIRDNNDGIRDELYLKCDQDEVAFGGKTIPLNQKERLYQRATIINQLFEKHKQQGVKKQTSIFIHVDSNNHGVRQDVFFYHLKKSKVSKEIAETLHETFKEKYRQHQASRTYHGTVTGRDLYMLRETSPYGVYIELANIRNPEDQRRIVLKENREALAKWLADGLVKALTP
ncbi:MAG: N-acetylmuramoyl-L-alanine amidase [Saprospiraceae bacterium]|nr:N-acetylmuramoyl-L-alanine amidase [Saprospiraceae bacterium]